MEVAGEDTAVAEADEEVTSYGSDDDTLSWGDDGDDKSVGHGDAAAAADGKLASGVELESRSSEIVPLSAEQADAVHQVKAKIATLEATIESLRATGSVRGVQFIEGKLKKGRRKKRQRVKESPPVADACLRLRRAKEPSAAMQKRLTAQQQEKKREAEEANENHSAGLG